MTVDPAKLVHDYERGAVTRAELIARLCQAAANQPPEQIAPQLDPGLLMALMEVSSVPSEPELHRMTVAVRVASEFDFDEAVRTESGQLFIGLQRWRAYFAEIPPASEGGEAR